MANNSLAVSRHDSPLKPFPWATGVLARLTWWHMAMCCLAFLVLAQNLWVISQEMETLSVGGVLVEILGLALLIICALYPIPGGCLLIIYTVVLQLIPEVSLTGGSGLGAALILGYFAYRRALLLCVLGGGALMVTSLMVGENSFGMVYLGSGYLICCLVGYMLSQYLAQVESAQREAERLRTKSVLEQANLRHSLAQSLHD